MELQNSNQIIQELNKIHTIINKELFNNDLKKVINIFVKIVILTLH